MQYDVNSAKQYLEILEDDWRKKKLLEVRDMIFSKAPNITESIEYKMLRYGNDESSVFHLNAQKNYVALYVGNIDKIENGKELLKTFNLGKGCIRIKKNIDLNKTQIVEFIQNAISQWTEGKDISC